MPKTFVDTNIFFYSLDDAEPVKRDKARGALAALHRDSTGVISTQVMQELFVTATRELGSDPISIKEILRGMDVFEIVVVAPTLISDAIDCSVTSRLSFWDALIVVAAQSARCTELWTEDLQPGQVIRGVRVINPLS